MKNPDVARQIRPTVSRAFLEDWLAALRQNCSAVQFAELMEGAGLSSGAPPRGRVTHEQIVRLYQLAAVEMGDEMTGLWSRPIRPGALKHLCTSMRGASSLSAALFRFTSFWNLLLDDYSLHLDGDDEVFSMVLQSRNQDKPQRFGHMLLLKLAHGILSWFAGRELPLLRVDFAFDRPDFAEDYPVLFPATVRFGQTCSAIAFAQLSAAPGLARSDAEMQEFLQRAPRDWSFSEQREQALPLRIRELLLSSDQLQYGLQDAARDLNITSRTLIRRLNSENTSFQEIKDGLRRDFAIRDLNGSDKSIEAIAQDLGFSSAANFHRAFKRWTDLTPGNFRKLRIG